jgi:hypothetical protein
VVVLPNRGRLSSASRVMRGDDCKAEGDSHSAGFRGPVEFGEEDAMQTIPLSANAVAVLRLRIKGHRLPVTIDRLPVYRELADAGIMEAAEDSFEFTEDGWARREELLRESEEHLRGLEPRLPDRIELSDAARKVLARFMAGDSEVTDVNRDAYRELARAGIMDAVGTFSKDDDCFFRLTRQGWERRYEFYRPSRKFSALAIARSLFLAASRIGKGVSAAR